MPKLQYTDRRFGGPCTAVRDPRTQLASRSAGFAVGDGFFAHPLAEGVLHLGLLDEEVLLGRMFAGGLGALR